MKLIISLYDKLNIVRNVIIRVTQFILARYNVREFQGDKVVYLNLFKHRFILYWKKSTPLTLQIPLTSS